MYTVIRLMRSQRGLFSGCSQQVLLVPRGSRNTHRWPYWSLGHLPSDATRKPSAWSRAKLNEGSSRNNSGWDTNLEKGDGLVPRLICDDHKVGDDVFSRLRSHLCKVSGTKSKGAFLLEDLRLNSLGDMSIVAGELGRTAEELVSDRHRLGVFTHTILVDKGTNLQHPEVNGTRFKCSLRTDHRNWTIKFGW